MRLGVLVALVLGAGATWADSPPRIPIIDAHAHYTTSDAASLPVEAVLARLDVAGVQRLVVTGSPPSLAQQLYRQAPDGIIPLLGIYDDERDKSHWMHNVTLPARVAEQLQCGDWAGLGELHLFAPDAGQPVFAALVRLAAENGLVLMLHADAEVVDRAFALAPDLKVLWAHLGTDPRPDLVEAMLTRYPGLWVDTSVRDERIAPEGTLLPAWRALFERHPDRFVVAVDTFSLNRWQHYEDVVAKIRRWAGSLPPSLRSGLLHDNAARLFDSFLQGAGKIPPPCLPGVIR